MLCHGLGWVMSRFKDSLCDNIQHIGLHIQNPDFSIITS